MMTVRDLREVLEDFADDVEVRLGTQPRYPLESTVRGIASKSALAGCGARDELSEGEPDVLYILEGSQVGYFTRDAWNV